MNPNHQKVGARSHRNMLTILQKIYLLRLCRRRNVRSGHFWLQRPQVRLLVKCLILEILRCNIRQRNLKSDDISASFDLANKAPNRILMLRPPFRLPNSPKLFHT